MTTDNKTPDPTPALLSAARLAEIRKLAAPQKPMSSEQMSTYRGRVIRSLRALLAHIDALAAGEVPDGEALGRGLYERMGATQVAFEEIRLIQRRVPPWEPLSAENREMYIREALILYQQGFAAGAVAISGEGDDPATAGAILILMERRDREQREAHAAGRAEGETERARLVEDVRKWGKLYQERDATIARLQAELAEARAAVERANENEAIAREMMTKCAESERATLAGWARAKEEAEDAARAEGARAERERLAPLLVRAAAEIDAAADMVGEDENGVRDPEARAFAAELREAAEERACGAGGAGSPVERPPCPGEGWEWDAFALQWHQPGAKGPAIGRTF